MSQALPFLLAGPILRRVTANSVALWAVTSKPCKLSGSLFSDDVTFLAEDQGQIETKQIKVGERVYLQLIDIAPADALPENTTLYYDLQARSEGQSRSLTDYAPHLLYANQAYLSFEYRPTIKSALHGSCRKPHHPSEDGLLTVDDQLSRCIADNIARPSLLMMTGDQVYVDDVAGPMLVAIHQLIKTLGLYDEEWEHEDASSSEELFTHPCCYYQRENLLPKIIEDERLYKAFIAAKKKPVFTSVNAHNHLITFAEMMAMYLLVWSESCWSLVDLDNHTINPEFEIKYQEETRALLEFKAGLNKVQRCLAHIPSYMIFDDHDITDDWNLTRGWEELAYGNPFSKRIIGNGLIAYLLCQGWGNAPEKVAPLMPFWQKVNHQGNLVGQDDFIDELLNFNEWNYNLDTTPIVVVLDTRTQRWRSESNANKPSGLMDWESLSELQQTLMGHEAVIMVSPAPVFGVKLIETVQRIFTFFGKALMVDAENWMAHQGSANVLLNIFRHPKTPPHFFILSGDVHYSFVYDVSLRFKKHSPTIVQVTCSGIKNEFPKKLLAWLDRINFVLYHRYSPLNWFTKRRKMSVKVREPSVSDSPTLVNEAGIGYITLTQGNTQIEAKVLNQQHQEIRFEPSEDD